MTSANSLDHRGWGYAGGVRRVQRRVLRRVQRRGRRPRARPGAPRRSVGWAGLRSLPAKQHAPKARPLTATDRGRRGVVPGRPSSTNGYAAWSCAAAGCRTFALDGRASRPADTTSLPASLAASMPGGASPPDPPPPKHGTRQGYYEPLVTSLAAALPTERNSSPRRQGNQRGGRIVTSRRACLPCCYDSRRWHADRIVTLALLGRGVVLRTVGHGPVMDGSSRSMAGPSGVTNRSASDQRPGGAGGRR
jgi:hypothetical protein